MGDRYEIQRNLDGGDYWRWREVSDGSAGEWQGSFATRPECVAAVRELNGSRTIGLVDQDSGELVGLKAKPGKQPIVRVGPDEQVAALIDPGPPGPAGSQEPTPLRPASESGKAT